MSFDHNKFGAIPSTARPLNKAVCIGGQFDNDGHFGMVRKSDVLSVIGCASVASPNQQQLDFAAATLVFTAFGLTQNQSQARAQADKYTVSWSSSASDIFKQAPDQTWDVPVAVVVFAREW